MHACTANPPAAHNGRACGRLYLRVRAQALAYKLAARASKALIKAISPERAQRADLGLEHASCKHIVRARAPG
eukprot:6198087-Pleurochrysis_carterae.AAC.1